MWRFVAPRFEDRYRVVLFDHVGAGGSDLSAYSDERHGSLRGYAADVVELCDALDLRDAVFVGHSVSAMIGALAAIERPDLFARLVMIGPSPRYVDDGADYRGGFSEADMAKLLDLLDSNYLGWSQMLAPAIVANTDRPELGAELTNSFCRTDPRIARRFARVTFLSDNRADLPRVRTPTLVMQCSDDIVANENVGEFVHRSIPNSRLVRLAATGHCPNLSHPDEVVDVLAAYLADAA